VPSGGVSRASDVNGIDDSEGEVYTQGSGKETRKGWGTKDRNGTGRRKGRRRERQWRKGSRSGRQIVNKKVLLKYSKGR
jgi:hypothetical protein